MRRSRWPTTANGIMSTAERTNGRLQSPWRASPPAAGYTEMQKRFAANTVLSKEKCGKCADQIAQLMDEKILQGFGLLTHGDSSGEEYKPSVLSAHERDQRIRNTYAMVDLIDKGVGKILDALKKSGALEDTVIIFTADHGELMGDHGLWLKGPFFYESSLSFRSFSAASDIGRNTFTTSYTSIADD